MTQSPDPSHSSGIPDSLAPASQAPDRNLALDLVRRNNVELVKGVDRAQTTTVSALRTAVVVAQAIRPHLAALPLLLRPRRGEKS